ncbi:MAG: MFS transporter [Burkholderiales bacterium RIFCSPHIGHO2_12_FULL_69_20]|nr:MAG: MFS transporter [Burkholderiales bacterium RIFCSPHIGHO2_12_FULL_69_20]
MAPAPGTAASTHWPAVLAAALAGVAIAMNVGKVPLALPTLRDELGLSLVQAGWVSSMLTTLAVVAALGFGLAAGRIGALRMVLGGLGVSALASLGALAVPSLSASAGFKLLMATRLFEGAGFLAVSVAGPALISAATAPADRRFALGVWSSYMPAGAGLAMALSPLLLPSTGWRGLWAAAAAVLAVAAAAAWFQRAWYAPAGGSSHAAPAGPALAVLRQPLPWLLALAFGLWALQHFALIVWLPTFLKEQRGLSAGWVALLTCVMLLANVPGNLIGGALVQRGMPRGRLIAVAHTLTGLCGLGLFNEALPDGQRYGLCVALSFIGGVIPAAVMSSSALLARNPRQIGALQGLIMQGSQLGQFIGTPLIAAVVATSGQWASARWVTTGAAALGVLLGLAAWRAERQLAVSAAPAAAG